MQQLSDAELAAKTQEFRSRLQQGHSLDSLLPEAFAAVREASRRVLGMRHFDCQLVRCIGVQESLVAVSLVPGGATESLQLLLCCDDASCSTPNHLTWYASLCLHTSSACGYMSNTLLFCCNLLLQIGGMVLHDGQIAEMATGEGKTLVAVLAAYLNALPQSSSGVHVVTVNDYLAARDAEWMGKVYK